MNKEKEKNYLFLKVLRISLSVIIVALAIYMLITQDFRFMPYNIFLLSILLLVTGVYEYKKGRKGYGYLNMTASLFGFFVTFQGYFLN